MPTLNPEGPSPVPNVDKVTTISSSGSQEVTTTLPEGYSRFIIHLHKFRNTSGGTQLMQVRYNGDTGSNYDYVKHDGSTQFSASRFNIGRYSTPNGSEVNGTLKLYPQDTEITATFDGVCPSDNIQYTGVACRNTATTPPITSVTFGGGSGTITIDATVYGVVE